MKYRILKGCKTIETFNHVNVTYDDSNHLLSIFADAPMGDELLAEFKVAEEGE